MRRKVTPEMSLDILARYRTREPLSRIARDHKIAESTVVAVAQAAGAVARRKPSGGALSERQKQYCKERYEARELLKRIAGVVGCSEVTVSRVARELGCRPRQQRRCRFTVSTSARTVAGQQQETQQ